MDLSYCTHSEYDSDGFLGIQVDVYATSGSGDTPGHQLSPGGMDHRPVDPEGEIAEMCWIFEDGHQNLVFPLNDPRTESALPNLNKGATRLFDTGTFGAFPFHFTATLDPIDATCVVESHRVGGKIRLKNIEGVTFELDGTNVKITGATSVECGGQLALALGPAVDGMLSALKGFIATAAGTEANASGMGGMTALAGLTSAWPSTVGASISKGA